MNIQMVGDVVLAGWDHTNQRVQDRVREVLHPAGLVIGNLETVLTEVTTPPSAFSGGTWLRADPLAARSLELMGFKVVSVANNHALDFGRTGLRSTVRSLESCGIVAVGYGNSSPEAFAAKLIDVSSYRVAVIAATTTFTPGAWAAGPRDDFAGRSGIAAVRHRTWFVLPERVHNAMEEVRTAFTSGSASGNERIRLGGFVYERGDGFAQRSAADPRDLDHLKYSVEHARKVADVVIVSLHSQEVENRNGFAPPLFLEELHAACLSSGADVVMGHGPHFPRATIDRFGGFSAYALGDFVGDPAFAVKQPTDAYTSRGLAEDASAAELFTIRTHAVDRTSLMLEYDPESTLITLVDLVLGDGGIPRRKI